jgi:hypothetical protein
MMPKPNWLPALVLMSDYQGNWEKYVEAIYAFFKTDFVDRETKFLSLNVRLKRYPLSQGKEATFWHLVSEGSEEDNRLPDIRRCERIRWPRPIIEHSNESVVKAWKNERRSEVRICLWLEQQEYLVVLAQRKGYVLLWTAYTVTKDHQKRKLQKEYEAYKS